MYDYEREFAERRRFEAEGREGEPGALYGQRIVDMALEAYKAMRGVLDGQSHSGMSLALTETILAHAILELPLVPKEGEGDRLFLVGAGYAQEVSNLLKALEAEDEMRGEAHNKA